MDIFRKYLQSHPWIDFKLDLRRIPSNLWLLLGEVRSKCEHLASIPLDPEVAQEIHIIYMAKGALATTAIEGNTLSEDEARRIISKELKLPESSEYLGREIENIVSACNAILERLASDSGPEITCEEIRQFNHQVLAGLELQDGVVPGQVRHDVRGVPGYRGAPAEDCEYLLQRLVDWLNGPGFAPPQSELAFAFSIIKAIVAHLYLVWIHPFGDGNGRTARLLEFLLLIEAGVPTPAAHLLSNHYNHTRTEYYRHLRLASSRAAEGGVQAFIAYAARGFVDGLREQIAAVTSHVWLLTWQSYVLDRLRKTKLRPAIAYRRIELVLEISRGKEPVSIQSIRGLSPRLARLYAGKTDKTVSRDIGALENMGLVTRENGLVRVRQDDISHLLPLRRQQECPEKSEEVVR